MDNITSKVYNHMKLLSHQNGYVPTVRQTANQLSLTVNEVDGVINNMQQMERL